MEMELEMGIEIAYIVLITIAVAMLLWIVIGRKNRGELIVSLGKERRKAKRIEKIRWFILLITFLGLLIFHAIYSKEDILYIRFDILNDLVWILMCIVQIFRAYELIEIREKGISLNNNFYKYSRVSSYSWIEENALRVNYKDIFRQDVYFEVEVKDKDTALKADEALAKYISKNA